MSRFKTDALERTVRTIVQAIAGAVAAVVIGSGGWDAIDWNIVWKTGAFAGVVAVLFALGARNVGQGNTAAFIDPPPPEPEIKYIRTIAPAPLKRAAPKKKPRK